MGGSDNMTGFKIILECYNGASCKYEIFSAVFFFTIYQQVTNEKGERMKQTACIIKHYC